jgi:3-oxoacyl-[acyl-carrier protein] reductase
VPLTTLIRSQFVTARAVARHMVQQHSRVMPFVTALPARGPANVRANSPAFGAVESLAGYLTGPAGVRVVGIHSAAMAGTRTIEWSTENVARLG